MEVLLVLIEMVNVDMVAVFFAEKAGSGEHLNSSENIKKQVEDYFKSYKAERANKFIVYFQNFTNTYDSLENLKQKYDSALINEKIIGISIATRPDCINEDIVKLLSSYKEKYFVSVELGLQTSNNTTGKLINRGYDSKIFTDAVNLLRKYNIEVITHIMIGLPNETKEDLENTINFINKHDIQGVKIHSTYIIKNTKLEELFNNGLYTPLTLDNYIELACFTLSHLRKDIIIHRISGDAPKYLLVSPSWNLHKKWIINGIEKKLKDDDLWQGKFLSL